MPDDIINNVQKAPLLQQSDIVKHYVNLEVKWEGELRNAWIASQDSNIINLLISAINSKIFIQFTVNKKDYPELFLLDRGHIIKLIGKIESISSDLIYLYDVSIEI